MDIIQMYYAELIFISKLLKNNRKSYFLMNQILIQEMLNLLEILLINFL